MKLRKILGLLASLSVAGTLAGACNPARAAGTESLWPTATPVNADASDTHSVNLGVHFQSAVAGAVDGVRFYKGSTNTGTHVGSLWSTSGTLLASVTFTGETASGWQSANFSSPVNIAANTDYVVSYLAPVGRYAYDVNYFASPFTNGDLTAGTGNGVYTYGSSSAFPATASSGHDNYWVDLVFAPNAPAPTVPGAPTGLTATAGSGQISLGWSAPSNNGGESITSYRVYRSTTSGGETLLTGGGCSGLGAVTSCTDTGLTNGQAYFYKVSAVNGVGEGAQSGEASATPTAAVQYVLPGTVGYLGATSALTVYQPGGAALPGCAWQSYGLRCDNDNYTFDHVWIKGGVYWTGVGVFKLTNSIVQGGTGSEWYDLLGHPSSSGSLPGSKLVVYDSTLNWTPGVAFPSGQDVAPIWSLYGNQAIDAERDDLSVLPQGLPANTGSTLLDNWIHGLVQNRPSNPQHLDGIYSQGGSNITIKGNYIDVPVRSDVTAALFVQGDTTDTGISAQGNYFSGGSYVLWNETSQNMDVENNTWANSGVNGQVGPNNSTYPGTYGTWTGNVDSSGNTIPKP